jgi:hypothetical protein
MVTVAYFVPARPGEEALQIHFVSLRAVAEVMGFLAVDPVSVRRREVRRTIGLRQAG